jgi:hypothetical protein
MSSVSNSIRNGVLFVLVVLCVHYAVRTAVEDRSLLQRPQQTQAPQPPPQHDVVRQHDVAIASTPAPTSPISKQPAASAAAELDPELYDYVFGSRPTPSQAAQAPAPLPPMKAKAAPPAPPAQGPAYSAVAADGSGRDGAAPGANLSGCMVVGQYADEKGMCGGDLFDGAPGLEGYNSGSSVFTL